MSQPGITARAATPPTVTGLSPTSGPSDATTPLVISGTGFTGVTDIFFGTTDVSSSNAYPCPNSTAGCFTVDSPAQIHAYSPWHAGGTVDVTVTASGGTSSTSSADQFTYVAPVPAQAVLDVTAGPTAGGTAVKITAATLPGGFLGATSVTFGSTNVTGSCPPSPPGSGCFTKSNSNPDGEIDAVTPAGTAGTGTVTVTTAGGTSPCPANTPACEFTWAPAPAVTGVCAGTGTPPCTPPSGSDVGGVAITISGTNFQSANYAPPSAGQPALGYTTSEVDFVPTGAGSTVRVTGACPVPAGTPGAGCFTVDSPSTLSVTTPSTPPGSFNVEVVTPGGTSAPGNTYSATAAPPVVSSVTPSAGPTAGGQSVVIGGAGFTGATQISFGSTTVSGTPGCPPLIAGHGCFTVVSSTEIDATTPSGTATSPTSPVDVTVTTPAGTSPANPPADDYTYVPPPTVTNVNPASGSSSGGSSVTITGTNFTGPGYTVSSVTFGGTPAAVSSITPTSIAVTSPAHASGVVDVVVTTPGGTSSTSSADHFFYIAPPPTLTDVSPTAGSDAGGSQVTLSGSGFMAGTTSVAFGGTSIPSSTTYPCQSSTSGCFEVLDDDTILAYTPQHADGTVFVSVATNGGTTPQTDDAQYTFAPQAGVARLTSRQQYMLGGSDGSTWWTVDPTRLATSFTPTANDTAVVTANADLWTDTPGYNQDIGICVTGTSAGGPVGPAGCAVVAWKESGGRAGTFSPNAATVQATFPVLSGASVSVELVWKSNGQMRGGQHIWIGAGGAGAFSPTTLTTALYPTSGANLSSAQQAQQYSLSGSNGSTWTAIDSTHLSLTVSPSSTSVLSVTGNADLWTANSGINQDIGIAVFPHNGTFSGPLTWKESGGNAGTFSPNAAFVQGTTTLAAGSYTVELVWKSNHAMAGGQSIWAGAGHPQPGFSPTSLVARLEPAALIAGAGTVQQYFLTATSHDDGTGWRAVDATNLTLTVPAQGSACQVVLGGNADLWTANAGYNQDLGLMVTPQGGSAELLAWKESGGYAGTFSPNAAFVTDSFTLPAGTTLSVQLVWRTNRAMPVGDRIAIGAGNNSPFSPTTVAAYISC